nr:DUF3575 domain-containing protein [Bacteroides caccae]
MIRIRFSLVFILRRWFGPTKAGISLVWLIGRGNYNEKKGGRQ